MHLDVKTAFLYRDIKKDLYVEPPGFEQGDNLGCKLHKIIYGLKQPARLWNEKVNKVLTREELSRIKVK